MKKTEKSIKKYIILLIALFLCYLILVAFIKIYPEFKRDKTVKEYEIDMDDMVAEYETNNITVNSQESNLQRTEAEKAVKLYNDFLDGNITVEDININFLTTPEGEPNRRYATKYAFFDSNGDNIPELHINSARYYYILTYLNNKLIIWKNLSPYPQFYALNKGAFISHNFGAAPISDEYNYFIFDFLGNEIWKVSFSEYDKNENGLYDNDEYLFDGVNVSKETWDALTERYLYIDEKGIEQIRNEIDWKVLYDETN